MITIVVVERQAESRSKIVEELSLLLQSGADIDLLPRVNIVPLSPQELKFHGAPDLCIIGPGIIEYEPTDITTIRKLFPSAALLARLKNRGEDLALIEQLARMGVDDVFGDGISPGEFLKKLILLTRRAAQNKSGTLIVVDGGKGGVGVTSVVAGLGDALARNGKRAAVLDFDCDTQDLSRFLQARPFVNENLQLLFDQTRPVTQEFVEQCIVPVWEDEPLLRCMPPVAESDALFDSRSAYSRTMISILEILDALNEFVIVDAGCARGALLRTLYRLADVVIFVATNDPASLYASVDRLRHLKGYLAPDARLMLAQNAAIKHGIPHRILRSEFSRLLDLPPEECGTVLIPACKAGSRWPGSGGTLFSQGNDAVKRGFNALLADLGLDTSGEHKTLAAIKATLRKSFQREERAALPIVPRESLPRLDHIAAAELPAPIIYTTKNEITARSETEMPETAGETRVAHRLVGNLRFS